MKVEMISQFIDNELDLSEKITFVETVHADVNFKYDTIELLTQEKWIRSEVASLVPPVVVPTKSRWSMFTRRRMGTFASVLVLAVLLLFVGRHLPQLSVDRHISSVPTLHRFVVYQPDVEKAELVGSFTGWEPMAMTRIAGYWELVMPLTEGEHRFSYIFDDVTKVPDPTIPVREKDDFGGENSILEIRRAI